MSADVAGGGKEELYEGYRERLETLLEIEDLEVDDLKDREHLMELVERARESSLAESLEDDLDELTEVLQEERDLLSDVFGYEIDTPTGVTGEVSVDIDWLVPRLHELVTMYGDIGQEGQYEEMLEAASPVGEEFVQPNALEVRDTVQTKRNKDIKKLTDVSDEELKTASDLGSYLSDVKAPSWKWRSRRAWKDENLLIHGNKESDEKRIDTSVMKGENLLLRSQDVRVYDSILEGRNLFKRSEEVTVEDSVLRGYNLLKRSQDLFVENSLLYGFNTLKYAGDTKVHDSMVVGFAPLKFRTDEGDEARIVNSVIVGYSPLAGYEGIDLEHSVVAAAELPENRSVLENMSVKDTYFVTRDRVLYIESRQEMYEATYREDGCFYRDELWEFHEFMEEKRESIT